MPRVTHVNPSFQPGTKRLGAGRASEAQRYKSGPKAGLRVGHAANSMAMPLHHLDEAARKKGWETRKSKYGPSGSMKRATAKLAKDHYK